MRIAVNTRFLLKDRLEGLGIYTYEIAGRLTQLLPEHEFHFIFDRKPDPSFIPEGVTAHVTGPQARHPFLWYWWFEFSIPALLKKIGADLFFSPDAYGSLRTEVPQLLTIHDLAFEHYPEHVPALVGKYYRHFTPQYCSKAAAVIAVSEQTAADLQQLYGIDAAKISVIHNGYSKEFSPLSPEEHETIRRLRTGGHPYFLYVGAIHPRKNVLKVLRAFEHLKTLHPQIPHRLLLLGRKAWGGNEWEQYLQSMKHRDQVIHLEFQNREMVADLTGAATAMVYPSLYEGFGLPVLEAMACGVPSITSTNSPMAQFAGDACMAVNPLQEGDIADAMWQICSNEKFRHQLAERCLQQSKKLSWDAAAEKIALLIEKRFANKNLL